MVTPAVDLDVHVFHDRRRRDPDHLHLDVRHLVIAPAATVIRINHESEAARWVGVDELSDPDLALDAGTGRMVRAALTALEQLS